MSVSIDSPQVQDISAELHRAAAQGGYHTLWLAIDGSDQPLPEIEGLAWTQRASVEVQLPHPEIDPRWLPRWFALNLELAQDAHLLNHSIVWALEELQPHHLRAGMGRRVSGWLTTPGDLAHVAAQHCTRLMLRRTPDSAGHFLLRLHDPAVLWAVWQILKPEQKSEWLGPLGRWHFLDPTGDLTLLDTPTDRHQGAESEPSHPLSAQQWQDMRNISPLHRAMQTLLGRPPAEPGQYKRWFLSGLRALQRANAARLDDPHSLSLFAELALTRHPRFDEHPDVQRLLKQRRYGEPLGGLLGSLTELDWQRLVAEIDQLASAA